MTEAAKIPPHIQKLIDEAKSVRFGSNEYWKLRCKYIEKYQDTTYEKWERDNCYMLWRILANKEY